MVLTFFIFQYNETDTLKQRHNHFTDVYVDYVAFNDAPLLRSVYVDHVFPEATKKGFDEVRGLVSCDKGCQKYIFSKDSSERIRSVTGLP